MNTLFPYQLRALDLVLDQPLGTRLLLSSPTGSGKSYILAAILYRNPTWLAVVPGPDIRDGILAKFPDLFNRIFTIQKLRNLLQSGGNTSGCSGLVVDECHHMLAKSYMDLLSFLPSPLTVIGLSATPYRAGLSERKEFSDFWTLKHSVLSESEAVRLGIVFAPKNIAVPLVDDDEISVKAGEFSVSSTVALYRNKIHSLLDLNYLDKSTIFAFSGKENCLQLEEASKGKIVAVLESTKNREEIFDRCVRKEIAIAQIRVVSEGVDKHFERLIDCSPTLSPNLWLQRYGRIRRVPTCEYWYTNHNFLRHCYLLGDLLPREEVAKAVSSFGGLPRNCGKTLGLETFGRFKPTTVELSGGVPVQLYTVAAVEGTTKVEFAAIASPTRATPFWFKKVSYGDSWGKWCRLIKEPEIPKGFSSPSPRPLSPKQREWWTRSATRFGISGEQTVDTKLFQILPILSDTKTCLATTLGHL